MVAAVHANHPMHSAAARWLDAALGSHTVVVAHHSVLEAYAVLTRLPSPNQGIVHRGADSVGNLFEGLLHTAVDTVSPDHRDRVGSLSGALATARFALPGGAYDLRIHVLGLSRTSSPLPTAAERALIISPFVSDDFFSTVHPERVDELVSRPESLDLLGAETLKKNVVVAHVFDDGSTPDVVAEQQRLSLDDPGRPLVGLHAKVFAFEKEGRARLFLGSANATGAAFNKNVEILIELAGPATELGIDRLCEGTGDEQGLRVLFHPYGGPDRGGDTDGETSLDQARRDIARLLFEGFVEPSGSEWAVTYRSRKRIPKFDDTKIYCWPLASVGHRRRVVAGEPFEERFETSLETISGFLAFELADDEGTLTRFVVPVPLVGVPDHRERFLLRALIGNGCGSFRTTSTFIAVHELAKVGHASGCRSGWPMPCERP